MVSDCRILHLKKITRGAFSFLSLHIKPLDDHHSIEYPVLLSWKQMDVLTLAQL